MHNNAISSFVWFVLVFVLSTTNSVCTLNVQKINTEDCCLGSLCGCGLEPEAFTCFPICRPGYGGKGKLCVNGTDQYSRKGYPLCKKSLPPGVGPEQIHIAFGQDPSTMVSVMWSTLTSGTPVLRLGTSKTHISYEYYGTTYVFDDKIANAKGVKYIHTVIVNNLKPNTRYYYTATTNNVTTYPFTFKTVLSGPNWSPNIVVFGDMGQFGGSPTLSSLMQEVINGWPDAMIHAGDYAYDLHDLGGTRGDNFMNRIQSVASHVQYMTIPGNHEAFHNFSHYINRFHMPQKEKSLNLYYSIDLGPAHIIFYNTEAYYGWGVKEQLDWLKSDLEKANKNRRERPWIITVGHRPLYCSNADKDCVNPPYFKDIEPLFHKAGVDLMIEAHEHSYERMYPVYNYTLMGKSYTNPKAMVHLVSGMAGCNEASLMCDNPIKSKQGPWSAKYYWVPGYNNYGRLKIFNSTHLSFTLVQDWYGTILDEIMLVQESHGPRD